MSIDEIPTRLGQPPQINPRILRMDSFQDEVKEPYLQNTIETETLADQYQPFFMDKGLFDLEMDPFNFELDDLDFSSYDNENHTSTLNVNANVVDMNCCNNEIPRAQSSLLQLNTTQFMNLYSNCDWEAIVQKKELGQIAPLPSTFNDYKDERNTQKRTPLAPRQPSYGSLLQISHPVSKNPEPTIKMEHVIKTEPLTCRITIPKEQYRPALSLGTSSVIHSPSDAQLKRCTQAGCTNRARSHHRCKKHGGARQCSFEGCHKNSQSRGLCIAHGGGSRCRFEGCKRASQSRGLCKSHGGGKFCAVSDCKKKAHLKQLCRMHGGGERCKVGRCEKWAQKKGWCMAHAKELDH